MCDELVELDQVGMAQRRDRAELAFEPQLGLVVVDRADLDRDVHVAAQIAPEIDDAHAATTELTHDVVAIADVSSRPLRHEKK